MFPFHLFSNRFSTVATVLVMLAALHANAQQNVRKVYTTYGGFWSSSVDTNSTVKPDNSHLLVGFSYKNQVYSTGVSDTMLSNRGIAFRTASFRSFLLANNAIQSNGSTKIGVGTKYGGNGNVSPVPVTNDLTEYLTDGKQGLDLGTALFNLPGSQMRYRVTSIHASRISDGVPDILVTQVGAPPASSVRDTFRFEDSLGNVIGNALPIVMANISILGTGNWKFYDPGTPCTYNAGLQGDRPLRMMAFELADFGLNAGNIALVSRFVHRVSGESDQAFVAYNNTAFTAAMGTVLPVTLESFDARKAGTDATLEWNVSASSHFSHFEIERGNASSSFETIGIEYLKSDVAKYGFTDTKPLAGINLYRLKLVDQDGSFSYSAVQNLRFEAGAALSVYPNPAINTVYVAAENGATISLMTVSGSVIQAPLNHEGSRTRIDVSGVPSGLYLIRVQNNSGTQTQRVLINH